MTICWIVLPFAIIGTRPLLEGLIRETRKTNELLRASRGFCAKGSPQPGLAQTPFLSVLGPSGCTLQNDGCLKRQTATMYLC